MTEKETDDVFYYAKERARWLSIKFSLQKENIIFPTHCPIFKTKLDYTVNNRPNKTYPVLVRKDEDDYQSFSLKNIWIISKKAYEILRKLTPQEIRFLGKAINKHY